MRIGQTRRRILSSLGLGAAAGLMHIPRSRAEDRLETTAVRIVKTPSICLAPAYVAEQLLRDEGFTDIRYIELDGPSRFEQVADFSGFFASSVVLRAEAGARLTVLTGMHVGCFELFANDSIKSVVDLKGKRVGVFALTAHRRTPLSALWRLRSGSTRPRTSIG